MKTIVLGLLLLVAGCSGSEMTPEQEVRDYIAKGLEAVENRNSSASMELVHPRYQDKQGQDVKQLEKLLRLYFFRNRNIYLLGKINEIELLGPDQARVHMHVAMAATAISDPGLLTSLRARVYAFELWLVKEDRWLLQEASWKPAGIGDME